LRAYTRTARQQYLLLLASVLLLCVFFKRDIDLDARAGTCGHVSRDG